MPVPCSWDVVDPSEVCSDWNDYDQAAKDSALWLASTYLWAATGRRFGACPVSVRPSQNGRGEIAYQTFPVAPGLGSLGEPGGPFLFGGTWYNAGCASACCGNSACAVVLRGPVASVDEVLIGDEVVPPSAYRVDITRGTWLLVRIDGECWPTCQDMSAEPGEEGAFEVSYHFGSALPEALAIATSILACEYGQFFTSGACRLPSKMTRLSRQGVEVELETATPNPATGTTGIRQVDDVIWALNPTGRQSRPMLLSPDLPESCDRVTVIGAGS